MPSALVIAVSGIGNTILQSPLIAALLARPDLEVDVLFGSGAIREVFAGDARIREQFVLPKGLSKKVALVRKLAAKRYDYSIACFPSNRIEFNVLPFVIGARKRVTHGYSAGRLRTLSFLSNVKIDADRQLHDVDQNLNLLGALDMDPAVASRELVFGMNAEYDAFAVEFFQQHGLRSETTIGIHAGCKRSESYRRWPTPHFIELIGTLNDRGYRCLLFAGPDEVEETNAIVSGLDPARGNVMVTGLSLGKVAAVIRRCKGFLSTDSGLGHVARAVHVPTLAIFGPAQASRTAPYGRRGGHVSLNLHCSPCLAYPFDATHSRIDCPYEYRCLREMPAAKVAGELERLIA